VVIQRGDVWWADLRAPQGSEPAFRRPILIVQADAFNQSRLNTVIGVALTSNIRLVDAPGNVLLLKKVSGLPKDSVANVSQIVTVDRTFLSEKTGHITGQTWKSVETGLRLVLAL
jgi:mRNA interferase MazF